MAENIQTAVLRILCRKPDAVSIDALLGYLNVPGSAVGRKALLLALGKLMQKRLVERANGTSFQNKTAPQYRATDAGRALIASGKAVTSGNNGKWTAPPRVLPDTARQRMWTVFRLSKKATFSALVEAVRQKGEDADAMIDNARKLFAALARAGIVVRLKDREAGCAPSSNGFLRYALVKDLGPVVPVPCTTSVFDPNARTHIPYATKKANKP